MKILCSIFVIFSCLSTFAQGPFEWPEDMQVDPTDYNLKELKVRKITQYKKCGASCKSADSTKQNESFIDYIVEYDSLQRLNSFKYKFLNHVQYYHYFGDSLKIDSLRKISEEKEIPLLFIKLNDQWVIKNYWEVKFIYDDHGLSRMEVLDRYLRFGVSGVLDGVYTQKSAEVEITTKYHYNEFGELIKEEGFSGDTLMYENLYRYETFENQGETGRLLTQSVIDGIIYDIEYVFY